MKRFGAYEIADVRFRAGVSTQLELTDARLMHGEPFAQQD